MEFEVYTATSSGYYLDTVTLDTHSCSEALEMLTGHYSQEIFVMFADAPCEVVC